MVGLQNIVRTMNLSVEGSKKAVKVKPATEVKVELNNGKKFDGLVIDFGMDFIKIHNSKTETASVYNIVNGVVENIADIKVVK